MKYLKHGHIHAVAAKQAIYFHWWNGSRAFLLSGRPKLNTLWQRPEKFKNKLKKILTYTGLTYTIGLKSLSRKRLESEAWLRLEENKVAVFPTE